MNGIFSGTNTKADSTGIGRMMVAPMENTNSDTRKVAGSPEREIRKSRSWSQMEAI
jgi:hypothetical protein